MKHWCGTLCVAVCYIVKHTIRVCVCTHKAFTNGKQRAVVLDAKGLGHIQKSCGVLFLIVCSTHCSSHVCVCVYNIKCSKALSRLGMGPNLERSEVEKSLKSVKIKSLMGEMPDPNKLKKAHEYAVNVKIEQKLEIWQQNSLTDDHLIAIVSVHLHTHTHTHTHTHKYI